MVELVSCLDTQDPTTTVDCLRTNDGRSTGRMVSIETIDDTTLELMLIDMKWLNECAREAVAKR